MKDQNQARHWTRSNTIMALAVGSVLLSLPWVRLNVEPSVPLGVYRLHGIRTPLTRGMLVLFLVPATMQRWHSRWVPLLKPIAAVAGEVVCVDDDGLHIGMEAYGRVYIEAGGEHLPHMTGCLTVGDGEVFVASKTYRSLDSRYFGPVKIAVLAAWATPVLVWRSPWIRNASEGDKHGSGR